MCSFDISKDTRSVMTNFKELTVCAKNVAFILENNNSISVGTFGHGMLNFKYISRLCTTKLIPTLPLYEYFICSYYLSKHVH